MKYKVKFSDDAIADFKDIATLITNEFGMPKTAFKYLEGLKEKIKELEKYPERYNVRLDKSTIENYGFNMRRLNYKKVVVIYTIIDNVVWIVRAPWAYSLAGLN